MAQPRGKIDIFLEKMISRKLFVFVLAVGFLGAGKIDSDNFIDIAKIYIGSQAVVDTIASVRRRNDGEKAEEPIG